MRDGCHIDKSMVHSDGCVQTGSAQAKSNRRCESDSDTESIKKSLTERFSCEKALHQALDRVCGTVCDLVREHPQKTCVKLHQLKLDEELPLEVTAEKHSFENVRILKQKLENAQNDLTMLRLRLSAEGLLGDGPELDSLVVQELNSDTHDRNRVNPPSHPAPAATPDPDLPMRRAHAALNRAFPPPVAAAILAGRPVVPVTRSCVSVFFADVVGFTALSSAMHPAKVVGLLDRLFAELDALAALHGVQKVDVIGDAYLAAANLHDDQPDDHAARMAAFALAALAAARRIPIDPDDDDARAGAPRACAQLRGGIHCGPATAALLGTWGGLKYTLVGDTVNVAARMESSSAPGRVQLSAAAAALLARQAPAVPLAPRPGGADAKGLGNVPTFWLGAEAEARPEPACEPSGPGVGPPCGGLRQ